MVCTSPPPLTPYSFLIISDNIFGLFRLMVITGILTLATAAAYWSVVSESEQASTEST